MLEKIIHGIEKFYIRITVWILFLKKEKVYGKKGLKFSKLFYLAKGFYSDHPVPYDFKNNKYSDYISDIETIKLAYLNHPYGRLLRNKLIFSNYFRSYFTTPECYCIINKGIFEPVNSKISIDSLAVLTEFTQKKQLILKPLLGTGGSGIILLESGSNSDLYLNKQPIDHNELQKLIVSLDNYLVTEFIQQGRFTAQFFPDTANTIRITTMCDPEKVSSFIPYSFMRFGRQRTIPADNISLGGLFSMIDLNTGELTEAFEVVKNQKVKFHSSHPDTNAKIQGTVIPGWINLRDVFIGIGSIIKPFIKIVGWDIILTDNSFAVIEANNGPDLYMQAVSYPFAKNPTVGKFLKEYHIRK